MNALVKHLFVLVFGLGVLGGLFAQNPIEILEARRQFGLAEAYWQVAERFAQLGQNERAAQFRRAAGQWFPGYRGPGSVAVPGQALDGGAVPAGSSSPTVTSPGTPSQPAVPAGTVVDPLTGLPDRPQVREAALDGERIARYQVGKLLRQFAARQVTGVLSVFAFPVQISGQSLDAASLGAGLQGLYTSLGDDPLALADLVHLDSLRLLPGPQQTWTALVERVQDGPEWLSAPFGGAALIEMTLVREGSLWKVSGLRGQ